MNTLFLQLFLFINVFLIGVLATIAIRHAYAHFRPHPSEPSKPRAVAQVVHLPPATKERLLHASEANFQAVLARSATQLDHNLQATASQLNKQLEKLGNEIISDEMTRYRASLDELRARTELTIGSAQSEIVRHQAELKAKLAERQAELEAKLMEEIKVEKQQLLQQIDTKLADAVASFLLETLQHNVDLGAQSTYLTAMLNEHKAELTKGIIDEA